MNKKLKEIEFKVKGSSNVHKVAGAITGALNDNKKVTIKAIGSAATCQAIKSVAVANKITISAGYIILALPSFFQTEINDKDMTGIIISLIKVKNELLEITEL